LTSFVKISETVPTLGVYCIAEALFITNISKDGIDAVNFRNICKQGQHKY